MDTDVALEILRKQMRENPVLAKQIRERTADGNAVVTVNPDGSIHVKKPRSRLEKRIYHNRRKQLAGLR